LTLTGARKGTTCPGVHFDGAATGNINLGAIHNAAAKFYVSLRFKLDQNFSSANTTNQGLWGKIIGAADKMQLLLRATDGKLQFYFETTGGGVEINVLSTETSWTAGQVYHVLFSISDANAFRMLIDNGTPITDASVTPVLNGGDVVIGDNDDPGAGMGFQGVITDYFSEEGNDLTTTEETDLYNGIPPATVDNFLPMDEGRGVTAYDRGADGDDGTLDTTATWAQGQVVQPALSLDGINDTAISGSGVSIAGDLVMVWAGKMKSTYNTAGAHHFFGIRVDGTNQLYLGVTSNQFWAYAVGDGTAQTALTAAYKPSIDDYRIMMLIMRASTVELWFNGLLIHSVAGVGVVSGAPAHARLGVSTAGGQNDLSKPLMAALIEGAFSAAQAEDYSRYLKKVFNLPIANL